MKMFPVNATEKLVAFDVFGIMRIDISTRVISNSL